MSNVFLIRQDLSRSVDISDINIVRDSKNMSDDTFKTIFDKAKAKYLKKNPDAKYVVFEQCKATHLGYVNANNSLYPAEYGDQNAASWTTPYEKPVLINHDLMGAPLGRHVSAEYVPFTLSESQKKSIKVPKGVVLTHSVITDWDAMNKVLDGRYLTVSITGKSAVCKCSICGQDWTALSDRDDYCGHEPGNYYNGKLCYKITGSLNYVERSFVNNPADQTSGHAATLTNYEMLIPDAQIKDEAYIAQNMIYSKESPVIRDSAGYTLFLAQDSNGSYPVGKPFYAFTLGNRQNVVDVVGDSLNDDDENNISGVCQSTGQSDANLSTHSDTEITPSNVPNKNKEQDSMEWKDVSIQSALDNVVGLNSHIDAIVEKKVKELVADAVAQKEQAVKDAEVAKTSLSDAQKTIEDLTAKSVATTTDSIIALMAEMKKPQYMKLVSDAAGDTAKLEDSIKVLKDKFVARGLSAVSDMLSDLREESVLIANSNETHTDADLTKPAGDGIQSKTEPSTTVSDSRTDNTDTARPAVTGARKRLPISI